MAGAIIKNSEISGFGGTAIDIEGGGGYSFNNCVMFGSVEVKNSYGNSFGNSTIISTSKSPLPFNLGRNKPCNCGSGKKFKRCHGSVERVATGIKSKNSSSSFDDTRIVTDGVGIDLDNDRSSFKKTVIIAGDQIDFVALAREWGIPEYVPVKDVEEAVRELQTTKNPVTLEKSSLKNTLEKNGFDMACWAQIAMSIITFCFS
ncbi:SEC-C domain-containing protein [Pseudomonas sp. G5(2012)]|uniref:SEC-C domain-containing protein n=1 Tax=Pseudomonas sp. G5(2012) TaxID=1268068 RepID=UPI0009DC064B|nr:SEC-C domain-containing protein [Pseudomonas sp. G5(2012)]